MTRLLPLALSLLLVLMGQSLAVARGQTQVAGQIVLCAGGTVSVVDIGPDGTPIKAPVYCPDMALSLLHAIAAPDAAPAVAANSHPFQHFDRAHRPAAQEATPARARDPPRQGLA